MDGKHDARGLHAGAPEYDGEHFDDELHRRVVVVVEEHFEHPRLFDTRLHIDVGRDAGVPVVDVFFVGAGPEPEHAWAPR